jgi:mRNA interferase RelE/StbE
MTVRFTKSFVKDLDALQPTYRARVEKTIRQIEAATTLNELRQLKKLQGRLGFFRIRVGDYRLGLATVSGETTLVRCLDRKEFYRHFP